MLSSYDIFFYQAAEVLTEGLIYLMVVFSPWAFGTTQDWSIWTMNVAGYALGLLLSLKLAIRWFKGYHPPRWDASSLARIGREGDRRADEGAAVRGSRFVVSSPVVPLPSTLPLTRILAVLTIVILAYCLVSSLNPRPLSLQTGEMNGYIRWLPSSVDPGRTRFFFWNYLALACGFWGVWDWLAGMSAHEERASLVRGEARLPARLRRLLWVLCLNGGLLAAECIVQRLSHTSKLLWLVEPRIHKTAETQFGPYAYRSNGAQYLNLLWPVCLGFWGICHRARGFRASAHHLLLACAAIMVAGAIIALSRASIVVAVGLMLTAVPCLAMGYGDDRKPRREAGRSRFQTLGVMAAFAAVVLVLAFGLSWKQLKPRMNEFGEGLDGRLKLTAEGVAIAGDYQPWGCGPGTLSTVYGLYYPSPGSAWQLHDDWIETLATFGWVGSAFVALSFLAVLARWFVLDGVFVDRRLVILIWLAIGGCLVQAKVDFPLQIYSILFLFLVLCAILFTLSRRPLVRGSL